MKTLGGIPIHWENGEARYTIAPSVHNATPSSESDFDNEVRAAVDTYNALDEINLTERVLPPDSVNENGGGDPDGLNNIVMLTPEQWDLTELPHNVLMSTRIRYSVYTGEQIDVDILINSNPHSVTQNTDFEWSSTGGVTNGKLDIRNAITHEFGHFLGERDVFNPGDAGYVFGIGMGAHNEEQTMYGLINVNQINKRTLYDDGNIPRVEGDIAGIEAIYNAVDSSLAEIALVFDGSANFASNVYNGFTFSVNSAIELVNKLRNGDRVAIINSNFTDYSLNGFSKEGAIAYLSTMQSGGPGNVAQRLSQANLELSINGNPNRQKIIILFSAGEEYSSPSILDDSYDLPSYPVNTFGFPQGNRDLMSWLAHQTGSDYYELISADEMSNAVNLIWYRLLGIQVTYLSDPATL